MRRFLLLAAAVAAPLNWMKRLSYSSDTLNKACTLRRVHSVDSLFRGSTKNTIRKESTLRREHTLRLVASKDSLNSATLRRAQSKASLKSATPRRAQSKDSLKSATLRRAQSKESLKSAILTRRRDSAIAAVAVPRRFALKRQQQSATLSDAAPAPPLFEEGFEGRVLCIEDTHEMHKQDEGFGTFDTTALVNYLNVATKRQAKDKPRKERGVVEVFVTDVRNTQATDVEVSPTAPSFDAVFESPGRLGRRRPTSRHRASNAPPTAGATASGRQTMYRCGLQLAELIDGLPAFKHAVMAQDPRCGTPRLSIAEVRCEEGHYPSMRSVPLIVGADNRTVSLVFSSDSPSEVPASFVVATRPSVLAGPPGFDTFQLYSPWNPSGAGTTCTRPDQANHDDLWVLPGLSWL